MGEGLGFACVVEGRGISPWQDLVEMLGRESSSESGHRDALGPCLCVPQSCIC